MLAMKSSGWFEDAGWWQVLLAVIALLLAGYALYRQVTAERSANERAAAAEARLESAEQRAAVVEQERREDRLREQARRLIFEVSPHATEALSDGTANTTIQVAIRNTSTEPVRDLKLVVGSGPASGEYAVTELDSLAGGGVHQAAQGLKVRPVSHGPVVLNWRATFTDSRGQRWEHQSQSGLRPISEDRP